MPHSQGIHIILIQASVSKTLHEHHNMNNISERTLINAIHKLSDHLRNLGIVNSIYDFKISRIDLYKDLSLEKNFHYNHFFSMLRIPRQKKYKNFGENCTHYYSNQNTSFAIYDKKIELLQNKNAVIEMSSDSTILRFELRIKKKNNIYKKYGIKTILHLLQNPLNLQIGFVNQIQKIFKLDAEVFTRLHNTYLGNDLKKMTFFYGEIYFENKKYHHILNNLTEEDRKKLLKKVAYNKKNKYLYYEARHLVNKLMVSNPRNYFIKLLRYYGYQNFINRNIFEIIKNSLKHTIQNEKKLKYLENKLNEIILLSYSNVYLQLKYSLCNHNTFNLTEIDNHYYY